MAQTQQPRHDSGAEFVDRLVTDPNNVQPLRVIRGYKGRAASPDRVRVYATADLRTAVEFPGDALLHEVPLPSNALGAKIFFLKGDTLLAPVPVAGAQNLQRYFRGPVAAAAAAGAVATPSTAAAQPLPAAATPLGTRRWPRSPRRNVTRGSVVPAAYYYYTYSPFAPCYYTFGLTCNYY